MRENTLCEVERVPTCVPVWVYATKGPCAHTKKLCICVQTQICVYMYVYLCVYICVCVAWSGSCSRRRQTWRISSGDKRQNQAEKKNETPTWMFVRQTCSLRKWGTHLGRTMYTQTCSDNLCSITEFPNLHPCIHFCYLLISSHISLSTY